MHAKMTIVVLVSRNRNEVFLLAKESRRNPALF